MIRNLTCVSGIVAALSLAACSSSGGDAAGTSGNVSVSSGATSPSPTAYTPAAGADAAIIATHITGCSSVATGEVGGGKQTGLTSTATCTLDGHTVIVDSFAGGGNGIAQLTGAEIYFATGGSWVAFLADDGVDADHTTLQMQLKNDGGGLIEESTNGTTPQVASIDAQKQIATLIAADLGGTVEHDPAAAN